jgi:hypothetical protein
LRWDILPEKSINPPLKALTPAEDLTFSVKKRAKGWVYRFFGQNILPLGQDPLSGYKKKGFLSNFHFF